MTQQRRRSAFIIGLRAFSAGLVAGTVLPLGITFGALWMAQRSGGCGAGSSGGCEMGAGALGLAAILPCFVIAVVVSLCVDLTRGSG
ncbi:hypothetical protein [Pseudotabrizicola sp. 4114]|uniref:hypothetical protein n=1 Tax=Pseudotabrizicola sp. 4114 TaxID=2817731 RepID=UPI002860F515|nr:hypothetical protein [Pseudorhodobacter sp. 4114]